ncbi:hypothetical protein [Prosthecobacter sp.]|uniref:hypothetical protein n=1 Tax=Prosthecobacter sp. TaxID=1965333 RepID=UPI00378322AB
MTTSSYHSPFRTLRGFPFPADGGKETSVLEVKERVGLALWQTVEQTFDERALADEKKRASLMSVRVKALGRLAKLYEVIEGQRKKGRRRGEFEQVEPATPEEIAEAVRKWREERGK